MSIQFVLGPAGCGKTRFLHDLVLKEGSKYKKKKYYVVVPEQFTMATQQKLVELSENNCIMNVDVVSFQRLAYHVFEELGTHQEQILEEAGKNLILQKVANKKENELKILKGNLKKPGYISELKSLISEFMQYHISTQELEDLLKEEGLKVAFQYKLQDIVRIYKGFQEELEGKYITSEEILEELINVCRESELLKGAVFVFDGFTGFTPIQNMLLKELMELSQKVYISLTIDTNENLFDYKNNYELFSMTKKTIESVCSMAREGEVVIEEPLMLSHDYSKKYENSPGIFHIEEHLFRKKPGKKVKIQNQEVVLAALKNPKEEVEYAAIQIQKLVREQHLRYKDIAVITMDMEGISHYVPKVFSDYNLPYFLDESKDVTANPFPQFLRSVLKVLANDFSYESMIRMLKFQIMPLAIEDIELFENYLLATNYRGWKNYEKLFSYKPKEFDEEQFAKVNELREYIISKFRPLKEKIQEKGSTVLDKTTAMYEFLVDLEVEETLRKKAAIFEEIGDFSKAMEYEKIYETVIELFDKMVELIGEESISLADYEKIIQAGLETGKIGMLPLGYDRVMVGDLQRSRLDDIKVLFFLRVNDGIVPKVETSTGILSALDRMILQEKKIELSPSIREKLFMQKFYIYLALSKPSDRLYMTYGKVGSDGKGMLPSFLIKNIEDLFENVKVKEISLEDTTEKILTQKSAFSYWIHHVEDEEKWELEQALDTYFQKQDEYKEKMRRVQDLRQFEYQHDLLKRAISNGLYGTNINYSVTRLERYAGCACAHFLEYGLGLKERSVSEFSMADMGNIYHCALENFAKLLGEKKKLWQDLTEEELKEFGKMAMDNAILALSNMEMAQSYKNRFFIKEMYETFQKTLEILTYQLQSGEFYPQDFEVAFENLTLSQNETIRLHGRIDRVDTMEKDGRVYVKVIDYKSGKKDLELVQVYYGLQLQLVVYMNAALQAIKKKNPEKEVVPAGLFYYHIDHPVIDGKGGESKEEIEDGIKEQLILDGRFDESDEVIQGLDKNVTGKSKVVKLNFKKDGSLKENSQALNSEAMKILSQYVAYESKELCEEMMSGNILASPYKLGNQSACDYCKYHAICGFDEKVKGYAYRSLKAMKKDEEVLAEMKKKMGEDKQ